MCDYSTLHPSCLFTSSLPRQTRVVWMWAISYFSDTGLNYNAQNAITTATQQRGPDVSSLADQSDSESNIGPDRAETATRPDTALPSFASAASSVAVKPKRNLHSGDMMLSRLLVIKRDTGAQICSRELGALAAGTKL